MMRGIAALAAVLTATWPDTYLARLEAWAQIEQLNADLLSHESATATLQQWCDSHGAAPGTRIVAHRVRGQDKAAGPAERAALGVAEGDRLRYRRVDLACGNRVLSRADNWYRPDRLTTQMNDVLDTTETPFGVAVQALDYRRRTLAVEVLFHPLPEDWQTRPQPAEPAGAMLAIPGEILRHHAVLVAKDGVAVSVVVETYTDAVLYRAPAR